MGVAKKYQAIKIKFFFLELAILIAYLLFFQSSGLSHITKIYTSRLLYPQALVIIGYLFVFGTIYYVIIFPLKFYKEYLLEHKFSLSNQTFSSWVKDEIKEVMVSSAIFLVLVELFYFLLIKSELLWWFWMALIWLLFSVFFARIFPTLILPLFYKYKEIDNVNLKEALVDLARRSGVKVLDVFQIDYSKKTKKANAALVGLGKSKRIILADNLLSNYSDREIKVVLGHELGHYKYLHMWRLILFGVISTFISFYLIFVLTNQIVRLLNISKLYDIEAFPTISLILVIFGFIMMPLSNGYSRRLEKEADAFSLLKTNDKGAFVSCMRKLAEQNLSDISPNRFIEILLYDHPPISKRIRFAEENFK